MNELFFPVIIFQYLLFSVLMFASKSKHNKMLGIAFLSSSIGYFLSYSYLEKATFFTENYFLCMFFMVLNTLLGTISRYDFFNQLLGSDRNRFHYVGSIILAFAVIILISISPVFLSYKDLAHVAISKTYFLVASLLFLQITVLNLSMVSRIKQQLIDGTDDLTPQRILILYWGRHFLFTLTILSATQMILLICFQFPALQTNLELVYSILHISDIILVPTITLLALAIGYFTLRNPAVFEFVESADGILTVEQRIVDTILPDQVKNANLQNLISDERFNEICDLISKSMEQNIYLESTLTVQSLADHLGIPKYQLSFVLNKKWAVKFNDFINSHRIEYALELMNKAENKGLTMFALAIDSGFNSESVFYTAFKKHKEVTPKQYFTGV